MTNPELARLKQEGHSLRRQLGIAKRYRTSAEVVAVLECALRRNTRRQAVLTKKVRISNTSAPKPHKMFREEV